MANSYRTCHICGRRRSIKYMVRAEKGQLREGRYMLRPRYRCREGNCDVQDGVKKLMQRLGVR